MNKKLLDTIQWKRESIYCFDSWKNWNITTIMAWVHWNELAWPQVLIELIEDIKVKTWKIIAVFANLKGMTKNIRQVEKNMNRCFIEWNNEKHMKNLELEK